MNQELAILLSARDQASRVFNQVGQSAQTLSQNLNQGLGGAIRGLGSIAGAPVRALGGLVDVFGRIGLAVFGVKETIEVFKGAIEGLVGPAMEMQKVETQLNAVLASTGGVAGVSAESANALAESLSQVTTFSAKSTLSTENLLLTFTKIGQDIFPQATETALNMATALGEDTSSAAIQLGKALQDPVLGITALRRVGVNFSDAQKDVVKAMVAAGDSAGAQALILKELETEFGNSARAAGTTFAGQLEILGNQFEHIKETVGMAVLPVLGQLLDTVRPLVTAFGEWLPGAIQSTEDAIGTVGELFRSLVAAWTEDAGALGLSLDIVRRVFGDTVANAIEPFVNAVMGAIIPLQQFVTQVEGIGAALLGGDFAAALDQAGTMMRGLIDSIVSWATGDGPGQIKDALVGLADSAWSWITVAAGKASDFLGGLVNAAAAWVTGGGLANMVTALAKLADAAWDWVLKAKDFALDKLGGLVDGVQAWIDSGGPGLVAAKLFVLAEHAWDWVQEATKTAAGMLGPIIQSVRDWVTTTAWPELQTQGTRLGNALYAGLDAGFAAAIKVGNLQPAIYALQGALEKVRIPENATTGWEAAGDAMRRLAGLVNLLIGGAAGGPPGGGLSGLLALKQKVDDFFAAAGFQLLGGIVLAFKNFALQVDAVVSAIDRLVRGKDTFKQAIQDIGTILKNTIDPIGFFNMGVDIVQGLINGIESKITALEDEAKKLGAIVPDWVSKLIKRGSPSQVMYDIGIDIGLGLINGIDSQTRGVADATNRMMGGVVKGVANAADKISNEVDGILRDLASVGSGMVNGGAGQSGRSGPSGGLGHSAPVPAGGGDALPWPQGGNVTVPQESPGTIHLASHQIAPGVWVTDRMPGFARGGIVPGALGSPMLAVVHGGETVTPAGKGGVNLYGDVNVFGLSVVDALNELSQMVG